MKSRTDLDIELKKTEISLKVGIVRMIYNVQFYNLVLNITSMIKRGLMTQTKWFFLALTISFVLVSSVESTFLQTGTLLKAQHTFLGLNLFLEILVFFVFSTFVVFGIKGFFEMYSQKASNIIIFISGVFLIFVIFILCFQILFQE